MADVKRTQCVPRTEDWKTLPWKDFQRNVFRLQQRIYQAARQGDVKRVHRPTPRLRIGGCCCALGRPAV